MRRTLGNELCSLFLTIMCLLAGSALICISAGAQESHAGQKPKTQNSAASQKKFKFEVVSIRPVKPGQERGGMGLLPAPDGYHTTMAVWQMIKTAYAPGNFENWGNTPLVNEPKWFYGNGNAYEINARVANEDLEAWQHQGPNRELLHSALRAMLKERCKLVVHLQPKEVPDYKLVIAKKGSKMMLNAADPKLTPFDHLAGGGYMAVTQMEGRHILEEYFHAATMQDLCTFLNIGAGRPPIDDATGLTGRYDFKLRPYPEGSDDDENEPTPFDVHPLGLDIKPGKYQGFSIVIDHVEKPDAN